MKTLLFLLLAISGFTVPFYYPPRGSIAPFISGDTFRSHSDFAYDELPPRFFPTLMREKGTIFVSGDYVDAFIETIHPQIRFPYILITHNSDNSYPGKHRALLDDPKILAWFTQNPDKTIHPKLHPLPIGLENKQWNPTNFEVLQRVREKNLPKVHLLYCNLAVATYPAERGFVYSKLGYAPFCYLQGRKNYESFVEDLASSKFVLSPRGNGLDTHRLWETLHAGSIPIVKTSSLDSLYEGLPVLIVNNWNEVTEEFLLKKYEEFQQREFSLEKLNVNYWFQWIDSYK